MLTNTIEPAVQGETTLARASGSGTPLAAFGRSVSSGSDGVDRRLTTLPTLVALEQAARPRTRLTGSTRSALSAPQFELFLERERSLADRGTRRFSLLVLHRRCSVGGEAKGARRLGRGALAQLARKICQHLRSTDVVGRLDADRVEILLTDTEPAGAQVVALWVELAGAELGLELEETIYVYPSVAESNTVKENGGGPPEDRPPTGGRSNGVASGRPTNGRTLNGHVDGQLNGHASNGTHVASRTAISREKLLPVADLWPRFGIPTPWWKRSLDILVSLSALLLLAPLFALIALAIRLDSRGPVIFRQMRAGRSARAFVFYKFRSMIANAEDARSALAAANEQDGPIFKIRKDPRTTRVGRWLRRWSVDELPQLWNVLKGDISLVGPRSPTLDEVRKYEHWQRRRLCVTGGITCTWQVSGRSQIPFRDWMRLDMRYVACRNVWLDLRLLVLTLPAVISGRGAC